MDGGSILDPSFQLSRTFQWRVQRFRRSFRDALNMRSEIRIFALQ